MDELTSHRLRACVGNAQGGKRLCRYDIVLVHFVHLDSALASKHVGWLVLSVCSDVASCLISHESLVPWRPGSCTAAFSPCRQHRFSSKLQVLRPSFTRRVVPSPLEWQDSAQQCMPRHWFDSIPTRVRHEFDTKSTLVDVQTAVLDICLLLNRRIPTQV